MPLIRPYRQFHSLFVGLCLWNYIGFGGLLLFSVNVLGGAGGANLGLGLMLIGFLARFHVNRSWLRTDPLFWLTLGFITYLLLNYVLTRDVLAVGQPERWEAVADLLRFGFLPALLVGFWFGKRPRWLYALLFLALAGFVIRILRQATWADIVSIADGLEKATFGNSSINFGLWCGVSLLGCLVFATRLYRWSKAKRIASLGAITWVLIVFFLLLGIAYSNSRAVWLAILFVLLAFLIGVVVMKKNPYRKSLINTLGAVTVLLIFAGALAWDQVQSRIGEAIPTLQMIAEGDTDDLPISSAGVRYYLYATALEALADRPLFGWGPGSPQAMIAQSDLPHLHHRDFSHFHNSYLDLGIQLGVVGLTFFAVFVFLLAAQLSSGVRNGRLSGDAALFLGSALLLMGLVALTNEVFVSRHGKHVFGLLAGLIYGAWIARHASDRVAYRS